MTCVMGLIEIISIMEWSSQPQLLEFSSTNPFWLKYLKFPEFLCFDKQNVAMRVLIKAERDFLGFGLRDKTFLTLTTLKCLRIKILDIHSYLIVDIALF